MAFLHASPASTKSDICVKMLLSPPDSHTPMMAERKDIGTIRMTASGMVSDSYCAARTRKTSNED